MLLHILEQDVKEKPKTIDEIPLEWCYGNGVVLNFCNKGPCEEISVEDVKRS